MLISLKQKFETANGIKNADTGKQTPFGKFYVRKLQS
jgi:hypothetical protein